MLRLVSLLAAATTVVLVVRWTLTRVDTLGRTRDFPAISSVLCLAIAVAAGVPVWRHGQLEDRLSTVASALAGASVRVRCETLSQAWTDAHAEAGYVRFDADGRPEPLATITEQTCGDLRAWLGSDRTRPTTAQVVSVHVLTHEAMHLAGRRDEAVTECAAVQRDAITAVRLGADPATARALTVAYWRDVYPRMPDAYRSGECAAGTAWDEHLPDAPWAR